MCIYVYSWPGILFQVKYLGENGVNTPLVGAAAICSPWDLLVGTFESLYIGFYYLFFFKKQNERTLETIGIFLSPIV